MEWVASTLHTISEHGVSSISTTMLTPRLPVVDRSDRFKWTRPFRRKTKSGFCSCAITFQTQPTAHCRSLLLSFGNLRDFRVPPRCKRHLRFSGILRGVDFFLNLRLWTGLLEI